MKEKTFLRAENPIRSGMETVLSFDMTERDFVSYGENIDRNFT